MTDKRNSKAVFKVWGKSSQKLVNRFVIAQTPMEVSGNSIFGKQGILSQVVMASLNTDFVEGHTQLARKLGDCPTGDGVFYHLGKLDFQTVLDAMNDALARSVRHYRCRNFFPRSVTCAIDVHDIPYYGKKDKVPVRGTKRKASTNYAHSFLTLNIVEHGRRFTVALLPFLPLDTLAEVVERLISIASKVIFIKLLIADRGFPGVEMISMLNRLGVKYLMAVQKWKGVKELLKRRRKFPFYTEYRMTDHTGKTAVTTLFVIKRKTERGYEKHCFITDLNVDCGADALDLAELYRSRWGIETSYRVKKEFRARTTSRKYAVRLLFFAYSALLYNIWILCSTVLTETVNFLEDGMSAKQLKTVTFLTYLSAFL